MLVLPSLAIWLTDASNWALAAVDAFCADEVIASTLFAWTTMGRGGHLAGLGAPSVRGTALPPPPLPPPPYYINNALMMYGDGDRDVEGELGCHYYDDNNGNGRRFADKNILFNFLFVKYLNFFSKFIFVI